MKKLLFFLIPIFGVGQTFDFECPELFMTMTVSPSIHISAAAPMNFYLNVDGDTEGYTFYDQLQSIHMDMPLDKYESHEGLTWPSPGNVNKEDLNDLDHRTHEQIYAGNVILRRRRTVAEKNDKYEVSNWIYFVKMGMNTWSYHGSSEVSLLNKTLTCSITLDTNPSIDIEHWKPHFMFFTIAKYNSFFDTWTTINNYVSGGHLESSGQTAVGTITLDNSHTSGKYRIWLYAYYEDEKSQGDVGIPVSSNGSLNIEANNFYHEFTIE